MPTLTRTWTSSQNNSCASNDSQLDQVTEIALDIKTKLVAAGWSVTQSSDGATTGASDLWVDTGDIIRGSGAHSWIVLKSPTNWPTTGKNIWFAIDYDTTQDYYLAFSSRGDADWTGLTTTVGPVNAITGATNQNPSYANDNVIVPSSLTNCKFHSSYSSEGDFIYYVSNSTAIQAHWGLIINKTSNYDSADLFPVSVFCRGPGSTSTALSSSTFYYTNFINPRYQKMFHYSTGVGSGAYNLGSEYGFSTTADFWNGMASAASGDDISGKIPAMPIYMSGAYPTGSRGLRGNLTDIWMCGGYTTSKASIGDVTPGTGTITHGCIGAIWVPCSVAPDFT
jgi:hypothetical protein